MGQQKNKLTLLYRHVRIHNLAESFTRVLVNMCSWIKVQSKQCSGSIAENLNL